MTWVARRNIRRVASWMKRVVSSACALAVRTKPATLWSMPSPRGGTPWMHKTKDTKSIQIKMDNGPESSGRRTQFLHRMVQFVDAIGKPVQLLYYPPYHSKYNPIERCWGILELHWNGSHHRCGHHGRVGQEYDLERSSADCGAESHGLSKGDIPGEKSHAGG